MNAQAIQSLALSVVTEWESNHNGIFSWPIDYFCPGDLSSPRNRSLQYHLHCAIIDAWNSEDRITECGEFHRKWLLDLSNIERVIEESAR